MAKQIDIRDRVRVPDILRQELNYERVGTGRGPFLMKEPEVKLI